MERDLVFFVVYFLAFIFILCCIKNTLLSFNCLFPACLKLYFLRAVILWDSVLYFCMWNALWFVELSVKFFHVWNVLWCFGILCCIFLRVERALVLWNVVLYFSVRFETCSFIVKFCDIFLCVWNALWYCGIYFYIFLRVERALVWWNYVLYFSICWKFWWR